MLKCCDLDFIEKWRDTIKSITGFEYKISKHNPGTGNGAHRQQYKLRVAQKELVDEAERITAHKSKIPDEVINGDNKIKVAFVQGLMDSEGWIQCNLSGGLGYDTMTLGFGCTDPWFDDFYQLVKTLGLRTSRIFKINPDKKKNGDDGKPFRLFHMDIPSYINAGLGFTMKRKADRLAFCSKILNDYTRDCPRYEDYY